VQLWRTAPNAAAFATVLTANTVSTKDGSVLHYKDWCRSSVVVSGHGYPLSSDGRGTRMLFLIQHGPRRHDDRSCAMLKS